MDPFALAEEDLNRSLAELAKAVEQVIIGNTLPEKKKAEMAARPLLREARSKLSVLRAEARRTVDPALRATHEAMCKDKDDRIRNYDAEMKSQIYPARAAPGRPKTFQEKREEEMMGPGGADGTGFTDATQVLQAATNVQKDAIESLQRAERLQHVTEETGRETLQTLQRQTEQMYQIDEELQNLSGELDRAAKEVKWFARQLGTDKCFLSLFGIVVVGLAVLTCVSIYTKRRDSNKKKNGASVCGPYGAYSVLAFLIMSLF